MKIAITADVHLKSQKEHPERYNALKNIFDQMVKDGINTLIIAGDTFDTTSHDYITLENFCRTNKPESIKLLIIPGNHDPHIDNTHFAIEGIDVITEPIFTKLGDSGFDFLLLPYRKGETMGEHIAMHKARLIDRKWILVGHGDWYEGLKDLNPLEDGTYMPLTRPDIQRYKPFKPI